MAVERLLGTTALLAVATQGAISPDNRMLGYNWKTDQAGKQIVAGYVKMPPAATSFVAGTKWQIYKRASPISTSTLIQNIEIGGGVVTGTAGSEQPVPGVANTALVQNDFYFVTIYHPNTQPGDYWFQSGGGNPVNGSLSGNCIFKNGSTATDPPDDETFTNGRFAVDVAIDDVVGSPITATLGVTLPVPALALTADADVNATLGFNLPVPALALTADADVAATLGLTLPIPQASFELDAVAQAALTILLPMPRVNLTIAEEIQAANLRQYVWNLLKSDAELNSLGINDNSLFGTLAPDSPAADLQKWMVIRWGLEEAPLHRETTSRRRFLSIWAYDRRRDFTDIDLMLHRARAVLSPLTAINYNNSGGWITEVTDNGYSDDVWDDAYEASARNWQLTIIASGL